MADVWAGISHACSPASLGLCLLGVVLGIVVGAIPGLTGAMLIALALPLTFAMEGGEALILLCSMYVGSVSGGLVSATLLKMPGTPAAMMTTLDGYPLAQKGQPARALALGISASLAGGLVSWLLLALLAHPVSQLASQLGPWEMFALVLAALVLMASASGESLAAGLFSGCLGVWVSLPGVSPANGKLRLTFGFEELNDGFKLLPVLIGLFAVAQVFSLLMRKKEGAEQPAAPVGAVWLSLGDWSMQGWNMLRSSLIGSWIGALPGIGANIGSVAAYGAAKHFSQHPERFGHGAEEGVVASEAANNATVGGALIPLFAMGVPGSVIDAVLLGALTLHGLRPGPLLMTDEPATVYAVIAAVLIANLLMFAVMSLSAGWLARLASTPRWLLAPAVLVFCVVGSYALSNRMFDVWVMLAFGAIGLAMERLKLPAAPFVIGLVLAPLAEENLAAGLSSSSGSYLPLLTQPIALALTLLSVALFVWPIVQRFRKSNNHNQPPEQ